VNAAVSTIKDGPVPKFESGGQNQINISFIFLGAYKIEYAKNFNLEGKAK
jgi:hypothetical protein